MKGDVEITADQFPNFLYDEENADFPEEGVEWNVENGLLTSKLCLWVWFYFFICSKTHLNIYRLTNVFLWGTDSGRQPRGKKKPQLVRLTGLLR